MNKLASSSVMVGEDMSPKKRLKRQMRSESVCVSNATNSRLPNDMRSRIFIGNLNTSVVTKRHLHVIFVQFGDIKAISMHKGYAFIQYGDEMDALNAVFAQDGQLIAGQAIDVNLVTEPKPHQRAGKSSSESESDGSANGGSVTNPMALENDSDCITNNKILESDMKDFIHECGDDIDGVHHINNHESTSASINDEELTNTNEEVPFIGENFEGHSKRVKLDNCSEVTGESLSIGVCDNDMEVNKESLETVNDMSLTQSSSLYHDAVQTNDLSISMIQTSLSIPESALFSKRLKLEPVPVTTVSQIQGQDILICGNCRTLFTSLSFFIQHKRTSKCRLRFVCHCHQQQS